MTDSFKHGYALLIGVGNYDYAKWSLPVTIKDAQALRVILTNKKLCAYPDSEEHIRFLYNGSASKQGILDGLSWLKTQTEGNNQATAVIYFSGHGWIDKNTEKYYLIPSDTEPFNIQETAVSAEEFTKVLQQISAKRLLVIIDSCHAEGMASAKDEPTIKLPSAFNQSAPPNRMLADLKQGEGRAIFTSSRGTQKSWIRTDNNLSIYTFHLIEALQGAGNKQGETIVRISNLMQHLSQSVPASAQKQRQAEQTPFFDLATEDFPVALLFGGEGLPTSKKQDTQPQQPRHHTTTINIKGDGNIIGSHNVSQTISASGKSTISDIIQIADTIVGSTSDSPQKATSPSEENLFESSSGDTKEIANLISMHQKLTLHFNLAELENLCFLLALNYENIPGKILEEKARELILYMHRRDRLPELMAVCSQLRPKVAWKS